jgi:hypothetical protein
MHQINQVHIINPSFFKIHINIILTSVPREASLAFNNHGIPYLREENPMEAERTVRDPVEIKPLAV